MVGGILKIQRKTGSLPFPGRNLYGNAKQLCNAFRKSKPHSGRMIVALSEYFSHIPFFKNIGQIFRRNTDSLIFHRKNHTFFFPFARKESLGSSFLYFTAFPTSWFNKYTSHRLSLYTEIPCKSNSSSN